MMPLMTRWSGVGKATIYRRFSCRGALAAEGLVREAARRWPAGSEPHDPEGYIQSDFSAVNKLAAGLTRLMADAQLDPRFKDRFRDDFIEQRRLALKQVLSRNAQFQSLTASEMNYAVDLVFDPMWYRLLVEHAKLTDVLALQLCRTARDFARGQTHKDNI